MTPIVFFPFTRMDEDQFRPMDLFFTGVRLMSLDPRTLSAPFFLKSLESGRLVAVSPDTDRLARAEEQVRAFREWAAVHRGNEKNLKALIRENTYFQDDTDVTAIQSGIRQGIARPAAEEPQTDPLLFLKFAEIFDRENQAIQTELSALDRSNSALFAELKGETVPGQPLGGKGGRPDPGTDRTGERIRAWCASAEETGLFDPGGDSVVLATTSPAVLDYLAANSDQVINGLDIDSIKVHEHDCDQRETWQQGFYHALEEFISGRKPTWTGPQDDGNCRCPAGGIKLVRFPGGRLNEEFNIPGTQVVVCLVKLNS